MLLMNAFQSDGMEGVVAILIVFVVAFAYHEYGHAFAADRLGDPTPRNHGRMTLNPFPHLSVTGFVLLIMFGFGWATTPVTPGYLRRPQRQSYALVSIAGPLMNLLMAIGMGLAYRALYGGSLGPDLPEISGFSLSTFLEVFLRQGVFINCILMMFNLLPIPPLDGFSIMQGILPIQLAHQLDFLRQYGMLLLMVIIFWSPIDVFAPARNLTQMLLYGGGF